jgi:hypothetical protein
MPQQSGDRPGSTDHVSIPELNQKFIVFVFVPATPGTDVHNRLPNPYIVESPQSAYNP